MTNIIKFAGHKAKKQPVLGARQSDYCDVVLLSSGDVVKDQATVEFVMKAYGAERLATWLTPEEWHRLPSVHKSYYVLNLDTCLYDLSPSVGRRA